MTTTDATETREEDGRLRRGRKTRLQILNAAIDLFGSKGFTATSMKDLAQAAGVQAPAIYNHFASKDRILAEALIWTLEEFKAQVVDGDDPRQTAIERLERLIRLHVAFQVANSPTVRSVDSLLEAVATGDLLTDEDRAAVGVFTQGYRRLVTQLIDDLRPTATADAPPTALCVLAVLALCDQSRRWSHGDGTSLDDVSDACWSFVRGMLHLA